MQICEKLYGTVTLSIAQAVQYHSGLWNSLTADGLEAPGHFQLGTFKIRGHKKLDIKYRGQFRHIQHTYWITS